MIEKYIINVRQMLDLKINLNYIHGFLIQNGCTESDIYLIYHAACVLGNHKPWALNISWHTFLLFKEWIMGDTFVAKNGELIVATFAIFLAILGVLFK